MRHEKIVLPRNPSLAPRKGSGVVAACLLLACAIAILTAIAILKAA